MSTWTHVVGAFRIDSIPGISKISLSDVSDVIGPMDLFDSPNDKSTLPCGSEGSLQYTVHQYGGGLPWVVVTVWGDLRDFDSDDHDALRLWWADLLAKLPTIRDAVLSVKCGDIQFTLGG